MAAIKIDQDDFPGNPKKDIKIMKLKLGKSEHEIYGSKMAAKNKRVAKWSHIKPTLHEHRRRLMMLIDKLAKKHEWRDVSGALSVLFKGMPRGCSLMEDRKHFMLAMEVLRRVPYSQGHTRKIKQIFDVWMSKLPWARKCSMKKHLIQMELALFCLMQDNIKEAHQTMKFLAQDPESGNDPHVHLIHGLTSYQIWYSELPQEMKVKDFDVFMQPDDSITFLNDGPPQHFGFLGRSSVHDSSNIQHAEIYAPSNSESSIGDVKAPAECNLKSQDRHKYEESTDEDMVDFHSNVIDTAANVSIFHTCGLDACLLPIRLHESIEEDTESMIISHKRLLNQHYMDASKHLKAALHSNPPILSALHPLMQLLLIGDQVEEALEELDVFFRTSKSMLPLRYKARLLECLGDARHTEIAKCHEQIVEIDPNHVSSLKRLIKLNMDGNYPTIQLVEYLALHVDHTNGDSSMWEELASCFLKIQSLRPSEYEEEEESTTRTTCLGLLTSQTTFTRIPKALTGVESRNLWIYRCKWWHKRHFSKGVYTSEIQTGDMKRMVYKAACACHMYGPDFKYVTELMLEGNRGRKSFIQQHRNSSLKLYQSLTMDNPF